MLNTLHPLASQRMSLGLSLHDVQSHLSARGFNYSTETLEAIERGERAIPLENPGFIVAISECLRLPVMDVHHTARQGKEALRAQHTFNNKVSGLKPQNRVLLHFVLKHPDLAMLPGFDIVFAIVQSIALQLPASWFKRK